MVKATDSLNRWLTKESIQEMLNCSQESIDLLINGLSKSIATTHNGLILINLNDLRSYLSEVKKLADPLLEGSASKKIKRLKGEKKPKTERMNRKQRVEAGYLTGKQVAGKLSCSYADILEFIKKHELKAGKFGRGWYINPKDLEEFLRKNQDKIKSVQSKKEEGVEQKDAKSQGYPAEEEEKKTEDSKEDLPSSDPVPNAVVSKENIIIVDPSKDHNHGKEQNKESSEPEADPPSQGGQQISNQPEKKDQEIINDNDPIKEKKKDNEEENRCSFITIRKTRYGCKIDDVAMALNLHINTPVKWITANQVKTVNGPGAKGDERYIEPKSLEEFLFKQRNTIVTFYETKTPQWPDARFPTHAH